MQSTFGESHSNEFLCSLHSEKVAQINFYAVYISRKLLLYIFLAFYIR